MKPLGIQLGAGPIILQTPYITAIQEKRHESVLS